MTGANTGFTSGVMRDFIPDFDEITLYQQQTEPITDQSDSIRQFHLADWSITKEAGRRGLVNTQH